MANQLESILGKVEIVGNADIVVAAFLDGEEDRVRGSGMAQSSGVGATRAIGFGPERAASGVFDVAIFIQRVS